MKDVVHITLAQPHIMTNPAQWPDDVLVVFEHSMTCDFATLTRQGTPITFPLTPYIGENERTLDVSTGLTYPAKAERARRNPKVSMLYADAVGSGLTNPPIVLVSGLATVRDADLQASTDRYIRLSFAKMPDAFKGMPKFILQHMQWYFTRIWIQVTPLVFSGGLKAVWRSNPDPGLPPSIHMPHLLIRHR
jgi:hypothetical protein